MMGKFNQMHCQWCGNRLWPDTMRKHFATCEKKKQAESHEASVDAFLRAAGDDPAKFKIKPIPRRR